ncbi:MAG TPA: hypothetical protein VK453_12650 [Micromonosporaceae bacterium]|nr:hypothetical protein [Micromonosporaceae bacterium]
MHTSTYDVPGVGLDDRSPEPPSPAPARFRVPLIGLAAVLAAGLVVTAAAALGGHRTVGTDPTAIDRCLVGNWEVTSYSESVTAAEIGTVQFRGSAPGAKVRLGENGKGAIEYGDGTAFASSLSITGQEVGIDLVLAGTVTYDFRTNGGLMSFTNVRADGTTTITTTTGRRQSEPLRGSIDPAQYTCQGNALTTFTAAYRAEMKRD